jgi:KaiC/GvpD/RAD55 family RecA-like ATPase
MPSNEQVAVQTQPSTERLPDELVEFLSRDTYSLVIKGESGTGKTILALTILKALQPLENLLYISTRTSPLQLFEYYPWIEEIFGPPGPLRDSLEKAETEGWETIVDSRLDEPSIAFERVTNVLMDKHAPVVVIDSWEALGDSLGSEALRTNLRVVETWRERAGARFIFIGESPANTAIDYMVEGVVLLKDRTAEGRRLREMVLSKLHGVHIRKPSHFFSLEGGTFRSFPEYAPDDYTFRNPLPVKFDRPLRREKGRIPSGYAPLDLALKGGFPPKSTALVEVGEGVDAKTALVLVSKLVQDWAAGGGKVVLQRPQGVEVGFVRKYAKSFLGKEKNRLVLWSRPELGPEITKSLKRGGKVLAVVSPPAEGGAGNRVWKGTVEALQSRAELTVVLGRPRLKWGAAGGATTRLRLLEIEGTLFVRGEVPWSPLFGVIPGMTAGNPMMQLEPVV